MSTILPRLAVCAAAVFFAAGRLSAQEPGLMPAPYERLAPMPEQGVVLLRNGQAIEGRITRAGDLYYVVLPEGEIRLKATEVELCCRNLEEGYLRKRAAIAADTAEEHLRLAQWCQRHGLLRAAAAELADARRIDPQHPMIDILQHRLEMAKEPPPKPAAPATVTGPSFETLDQMVRGLPPGTVEEFTQTIQPILINHCATAGCHGPQCESKLHLLRIPDGRPATRRQTQRNLYEVLQLIDREKPETSPLLAAAAKPHGATRAAIFNDRQGGQYQRLVKWVSEVAGRAQTQTAASSASASPHDAVQPAAALLPLPNGPKAKPLPAPQPDSGDPPQKRPAAQRGAAIEPFAPSDPFDPEVFNRRYFRPAK
jgi:hypothetical protein